MGGSVGNIVKAVAKPAVDLTQKVVSTAGSIVGVTPEQQQQVAAAQPTNTAENQAQGQATVSVQQGSPQAAAGAQGGEAEINVGTGRLNRNVAKARQNFRTPPSNTGTPGSSIRI